MNQPFNTTSCLESRDNETGEAKHVWSQIDHFIHCLEQSTRFQEMAVFGAIQSFHMYFGFHTSDNSRDCDPIHRNWLHVKRLRSEESQKSLQILSSFTFYFERRWLLTRQAKICFIAQIVFQKANHSSWTSPCRLVIIGIYSICYHKIQNKYAVFSV